MPELLSVSEIIERHQGKWVLMKLVNTEDDFLHWRGYCLAATKQRRKTSEALRQQERGEGHRYTIFLANRIATSGEELEEGRESARMLVQQLNAMFQSRTHAPGG